MITGIAVNLKQLESVCIIYALTEYVVYFHYIYYIYIYPTICLLTNLVFKIMNRK